MADDEFREITRQTRDLYDRQTPGYAESTRSYDFFPGLLGEIRRFLATATPGMRVIDVGCGAGRDARYLIHNGFSVVALDLSSRMLESTAAHCGFDPRLSLVQADMTRLPFRDASFGGAWVCASLLHLPSRYLPASLDELGRVLAHRAGVSISMKAGRGEGWQAGRTIGQVRWFTFVRPDEFAALMRGHGFIDVTVKPSGRHEWFVAEGRRG